VCRLSCTKQGDNKEQLSGAAGVGLDGQAEWGFCLHETEFEVWLLAS